MPELPPYEPSHGPIIWTAQWPSSAPDCDYPKLPGVELIRLLPDQDGQMNHHPLLQRLNGHFYLMHTHNPKSHHESSQGRNCLGWVSDAAGKKWTGPLEMIPPPDEVKKGFLRDLPDHDRHPIGFPVGFRLASDGHVYGITRLGYKRWTHTGAKAMMASHHTIGMAARRVDPDGSLGELFWIHRDEEWDSPYMAYRDATDTALAREIWAASGYWTPEGGGISPVGVRYPKPWRQQAPDGVQIAEYSTLPMGDGRALCLARANNQELIYRHYLAESADNGETWGPFRRTNIPTAQNWSSLGRLPDGRLFILGSLADRKQNIRRPLSIATSDDGKHFNQVWQIFDDKIHAVRHHEIHAGFIWVGICHNGGPGNSGRQDVAVVKIPVDALKPQA